MAQDLAQSIRDILAGSDQTPHAESTDSVNTDLKDPFSLGIIVRCDFWRSRGIWFYRRSLQCSAGLKIDE